MGKGDGWQYAKTAYWCGMTRPAAFTQAELR
jgi:hypothetical protein